MSNLPSKIAAKSVPLLKELLPTATLIGYLVNPSNPGAPVYAAVKQPVKQQPVRQSPVKHPTEKSNNRKTYLRDYMRKYMRQKRAKAKASS
jgi:hypothetical protein